MARVTPFSAAERESLRSYQREYMRKRREAQRAARPPIDCRECGGAFEAFGNTRYCSDDCYRAAHLRRRRDREYAPAPITCAHCGEPVAYKSGRKRYCSDACAVKAGTKRRRWQIMGLNPDNPGMPTSCDLCGATGRELQVDHDHRCCPGGGSCGQCVRGFLCRSCNVALGMFKDDPHLLRRAADYLQRSRQLRLVTRPAAPRSRPVLVSREVQDGSLPSREESPCTSTA